MNDTNAHAPAFDPMDPHGSTHAGGHHGHVIVHWRTQLIILFALLALTALTVFVAQAESLIIAEMGITIPHWVNILGAMIIAVVKATLVCMFFMQLKYDKPLNALVLFFCLFCVFLFLFFATLDLTSRGLIRPERAQYLVAGGTGEGLNGTVQDGTVSSNPGSPRIATGGLAITEFRFEQKRASYDSDRAMWSDYYHHQEETGAHPHRHEKDTTNYFALLGYDHPERSTEERSRPSHGLTPGLFAEHAPAHHAADHHDDAHADTDHAADDHAAETHTDDEHPADDHPEDDGH
ncbi:MAG: hypothetical protein DHS20C14_13020 [Phycisphaeraceae bacterium]|nr:MAG: hypothetical protein DHS20C14_13020 [Phycisphaeraceae bacterium]